MQNVSNNKAIVSLILFGIPIVGFAKYGLSLGGPLMVIFLIVYFFLPLIRSMRSDLKWLDRFVVISYLIIALTFLLFEFVGASQIYKSIIVIIFGVLALWPVHKIRNYFEKKESY